MAENEGKLVVVVMVDAGGEEEFEACVSSIKRCWQTDCGPFHEMDILRIDAGEGALLGNVCNKGLEAAQNADADWVLLMDVRTRLSGDAFKPLAGEMEEADGLWGLMATYIPDNDEFNVRMPQVLSLNDFNELLHFPPALTVGPPCFLRIPAACEIAYNPELTGSALEYDFAVRFWSRFRGRKLPAAMAGALSASNQPNSLDEEACLKVLFDARVNAGLTRENRNSVRLMSDKAMDVSSLFRKEGLTRPEHLGELTEMLPFRGYFDIQLSEEKGFVLFNNNDDPIVNQLIWQGNYRSLAGMVWITLAAAGSGLIADVGGFNGFFSFLASLASPMSQIVCFEPEREAFSRIMINIRANHLPNVTAVPYALDAALGLGTIYRQNDGNGLCPEATLQPRRNVGLLDGQPVSKITLDGFMVTLASAGNETQALVLVKIDVYGLEAQVLLGMNQTLAQCKPDFLITLYDTTDTLVVDGILREAGYAFYVLDEDNGEIKPSDTAAFEVNDPISLLATVKEKMNLEALFAKKDSNV
jgi:FkbM family methyltransferase